MSQSESSFFQALYRNKGDVSFIKRTFASYAKELEIPSQKIEKMKIAISEALSNVSKYAGGYAEINCFPILLFDQIIGIEIEIKDYGPGIENLELALNDKFSTGGSLGIGLGSMRRMVDKFEISSILESENFANRGTILNLGVFNSSESNNQRNLPKLKDFNINSEIWGISGRSKSSLTNKNGNSFYWNESEYKIFAVMISYSGIGGINKEKSNGLISYIQLMYNKEYNLEKIVLEVQKTLESAELLNGFLIRIDKESKNANYISFGSISAFVITETNVIIPFDAFSQELDQNSSKMSTKILKLPLEFMIIIHTDGISSEWTKNINSLNVQSLGHSFLVQQLIEDYWLQFKGCSVLIIQNY